MSAAERTLALPSAGAHTSGLAAFARRHPLVAYYLFAFIPTWILIVPILISQRGVGWTTLPDPLLLVFFIGASFIGPLPAAFVVTGLIDGRSGVRALLLRMVQWRVGIGWYVLVIVGYPLITLAAVTPALGLAPWGALLDNPSLVLSAYLPGIVFSMVIPGIGEEPGWRGFALPRLQRLYGPLWASLIQGVLHAFWHTPVYFVPGAVLPNGFDPMAYVGNSISIVAGTFVWTWLFNSTRGSVLFAMLVHASGDSTTRYLSQLSSADAGWWGYVSAWLIALLIIVATHGQLGYSGQPHSTEAGGTSA